MRISWGTGPNAPQVALGALVVELTGRVVQVAVVEAKQYEGRLREAYTEVAVNIPTGTFALQCFGDPPALEVDEKYVFTVEIENDTYGKAKQPRLRLVQVRPFVKTTAPPLVAPGAVKP